MAHGTLFVVATPIGNLGDSSARSLEVLRGVDLIACEDTRTSKTLLARHGISVPTVSLHEHNEREQAKQLVDRLKNGKSIALVSDAGTPGVSDPGALLVAAAHRAGIPVSPLPGASAVAAALSVSGFGAERFFFAGFLPAAAAARRKALEDLDLPVPVVFYEAPHRVADTLADLASRFGGREIVVARELSKKFEEVARLPLAEAVKWIETRQHGEFVLVLSPGEQRPPTALDAERVLGVLLESLAPSEAARIAARITGLPKRELYRKAMERSK